MHDAPAVNVEAGAADLAERLFAALPQTQCTRCGYPDCQRYAQAMAAGAADINRCPPGGHEGVQRLAALTGRPARPLDPAHGSEGPRTLAVIDEAWCIGCTLCIKACPVDCIVGAPKHMHTVIDALCTGCELCVPACPVDCIALVPATPVTPVTPLEPGKTGQGGWQVWSPEQAAVALKRYEARGARRDREQQENDERLAAKAAAKLADLAAHSRISDPDALAAKRAVVEAALARARQRRGPA